MHRRIQARFADRWEADRAAMLALPPVGPSQWYRFHTRLGRDHYIRIDLNDYSVHPRAIGTRIQVSCDTDQIRVTTDQGEILAEHPRCWARHHTITDPGHQQAADAMRGDFIHARATAAATARTAAALAPDDLGAAENHERSAASLLHAAEPIPADPRRQCGRRVLPRFHLRGTTSLGAHLSGRGTRSAGQRGAT
ncbi:Mu transposase domain-containing protein [Actinacidiphila oryziradicis]|uniref:Mu transposase domain-containing protein n=1 Tax=Actinacidiphila oryziradicis TaxID=2571141 RepID=UPI001FEAEE03|nr:hypothetical protein [Actinacidiphila oryziradicis]